MYQGLNQAQRRMTTFQRNVNSIMNKVASIFATVKIGETIKNSVQDAMSVESSIENLNRTLQTNSDAFQKWANSQAQAYGMSTKEAYRYGSTFSNLISSFQSDTGQLANSTQELMKVTSIVASNTGRTFENTAERIRSGLLGSTEAIEDLGIYTNISMLQSTEAFAKFANGKSWQQLDFQTQQQIRLAAILEQAYARYGDTLADTTQTKHNQFIASLKNVQLALGQAFLPIYNAVLPPLTAFMNTLARVISYIGAFTSALFGKPTQAKQQANAVKQQADAVSALNKSVSNTSKNLDKASKSAKKAKKEIGGLIGGLDEINNLSVTTTAGSSGTSSDSNKTSNTSTPSTGGLGNLDTIDMGEAIDTSGLDKKTKKIREVFAKIGKIIRENKNTIIAICAGLMAGLSVILISKWGTITSAFATHFPRLTKVFKLLGKLANPLGLLKKGLMALAGVNPIILGIAVVVGIVVGALVDLWKNNEDFRKKVVKTWKAIKDALTPWIEGLGIIFKTLADIVGTVLGVAFKILWGIIKSIIQVFAEESLDELEDLAPVLKDLGEKFKEFAKNVEKGWKKVKKYFKELGKIFENEGFFAGAGKLLTDVGGWIAQGLLDGIVWVLSGIANFLAEHIFKPIVEGIKKLFDIHSPSRVMKEIGGYIIEGLKNGMLALLNLLPDNIRKPLEKIIKKVIEFAKKIDIRWKKIKAAFAYINNYMKKYGLVKTIQMLFNKLKDKVKEKLKDIKDEFIKKVKDHFKEMKEKVQEKWDEIVDSVKDFFINIGSKVEDFKEKVSEKWDEVKDWAKNKFVEIGTKFSETKENLKKKWEDLTSNVKDKVADMKAKVANKWSDIKSKWGEISNNIKDKTADMKAKVASKWSDLKSKWQDIAGNIKEKTADMKAKIASKWSDLKTKWTDATCNIKTKTADMKAKIASKWSDLKSKWQNLTSNFKDKTMDFKVKLSTAVGNIKNFVNDIIKAINKNLIAKLSFSFTAPKWLGGKTWSWKAPEIPMLAKGGIIDSPTLAMVGEAGKEAVMPLENNTGWITDLAGKISTRMGNTGGQREVYNGDVVINLDGNTVLRQSVVSILRQMKRQGITI